MLSIPDTLRAARGTWQGTNRLHLPDVPTRDVPSSAAIELVAQGRFCTISYTWNFDGEPQDGLLLIGQGSDEHAITAVWVDSWHMGDAAMQCLGQSVSDTQITVHGTFAVENSPDWGWRIDLLTNQEAVQIVMYNLSPDGDEYLAVEASYARATNHQATLA